MHNLVETVGLDSELGKRGITYGNKNFEDIYNDLYEDDSQEDLIKVIDTAVREYFSKLELPSYPTLYDHLVLSLREKDVIATFNWDPFLYHACWRNHARVKIPRILFLHGNVAVGCCLEDMEKGKVGTTCSKCGKTYVPSKLLFPIRRKNYAITPFIKNEWDYLRQVLKCAYLITIFGYSAPQSDVEAITFMRDAWGSTHNRNLEQFEFIDLKNQRELKNTWGDFIHTHHYDATNDFYTSSIALFPRRTCEARWNSIMECRFLDQNPIPRKLGFKKLWEYYNILSQDEK